MASLAPSPIKPAGAKPTYLTFVWAAAALVCSAALAFWASTDERPPPAAVQPPAAPAATPASSAPVAPRANVVRLRQVGEARPAAHRRYNRSAGRPLCRAGATPAVLTLCQASWVRAQDYRARRLYQRALAQGGDPAAMKAAQLRWQARVDASAASPRAVKRLYLRRIRELQAELAPAAPSATITAAAPVPTLAAAVVVAGAPAVAVVTAAPPDFRDLPLWPADCVRMEPPASAGDGPEAAHSDSCGASAAEPGAPAAPLATGPPSP